MPYFVPTRFVWRFGGKQVHLCGSFTRWVETVPMVPVEQSPGMFAVLVHLPPGYHQYKFIVDGEWRHDETQPFMPDPLGNVNNWLYVRQPDATGAVPIGQHMVSSTPTPTSAGALQTDAASADARQRHLSDGASGAHSAPGGLAPAAAAALDGAGGRGGPGSGLSEAAVRGAVEGSGRMVEGGQSRLSRMVDSSSGAVLPPIALVEDEPGLTRKKVLDFLAAHAAYELIPESGKVVVIDVNFSVRHAFHALHDEAIASAPLWDGERHALVGVISASDFIATLQRLRAAAAAPGGYALSEAEMDRHTIRAMRALAAADGHEPKPLVFCRETDTFAAVVRVLVENRCSMAPIVASEPLAAEGADAPVGSAPLVLHLAALSGVLACLMRHFRTSLAFLPLLAQPLGSMPVGTWAPDSPIGQQGQAHSSEGCPASLTVAPIHTVQLGTPLTTALSMLLEAGVSALPVVDDAGALLDVFARADITLLARGAAYGRLQFEELTVGQSLALAGGGIVADGKDIASAPTTSKRTRLNVCTRHDPLRVVLERLAMPSMRRVIVAHPDTGRVEAVVSLSDVARFLFM